MEMSTVNTRPTRLPEDFGQLAVDSETLMAARSQPNDNWGSVGNGAKHGEKHVGGCSCM